MAVVKEQQANSNEQKTTGKVTMQKIKMKHSMPNLKTYTLQESNSESVR